MAGTWFYAFVDAIAGQVGISTSLVVLLAGALAAPAAISFADLSARMSEAAGKAAEVRLAPGRDALGKIVGSRPLPLAPPRPRPCCVAALAI